MVGDTYQPDGIILDVKNAIQRVVEINLELTAIQQNIQKNNTKKTIGKYNRFIKLRQQECDLATIKDTVQKIYVVDLLDREVFLHLQNRLYQKIEEVEAIVKQEMKNVAFEFV
jgi:hypothetical protein